MRTHTPSASVTPRARRAPFGRARRRAADGRVDRSGGAAFPVVVVLLAVLTGVVLAQMKRASTDERIAGNARESTALDNAAQILRHTAEAGGGLYNGVDPKGSAPAVASRPWRRPAASGS